jgi:heat shock protein 5
MVLTKMKETAEAYLGEKVTHPVVAVPACELIFVLPFLTHECRSDFNDAQRQATEDAGTIAGFKFFVSSMSSPLPLLPMVLTRRVGSLKSSFMILVVELSMFTYSRSTMVSLRSWQLPVIPTLVERILITASLTTSSSSTRKKTGSDVTSAMGKLKREVEKAKRTLSSQQSTRIEIESFEDGNDFSETLTRAKFEELNMDLLRKTMKPVEQVLKDAKVNKDVDEVNPFHIYHFQTV